MKQNPLGPPFLKQRLDLGQHIVADPKIRRGRPTFKGTRVIVMEVLDDVQAGMDWDFICCRWSHVGLKKEAITEAVMLARRSFLNVEGALARLQVAA